MRRRGLLIRAAAGACATSLTVAGCALAGSSGAAENDAPTATGRTAASSDRWQAELSRARRDTGAPGLTAAIVRDGEVEWSGAAGSLTAGGSVRATPQTHFITASTAKSVTAAMVLRLVDEGRVRLDDRVARWYPALPGSRRIRVAHLLRHTSGLPDYLDFRRISRRIDTRPSHRWTREELLRPVRRLRFRPGSRYAYSNTNMIVLGGIVEKTTGTTIQDAFETLVGRPIGLTRSTWVHETSPPSDLARPHLGGPGGVRTVWRGDRVPRDVWGQVWTDGGLATTAPELGLIANTLVAGDLLDPTTRAQMLRIGRGGSGLGVFVERVAGRRWIGHDGLYGGYSSQHWTDPATGTTITVMANLESTRRSPDASMLTFRRLAVTL